jgi:hypothetical protein
MHQTDTLILLEAGSSIPSQLYDLPPSVQCMLCYTPSDTLYYKTHIRIYMLPVGLPAA